MPRIIVNDSIPEYRKHETFTWCHLITPLHIVNIWLYSYTRSLHMKNTYINIIIMKVFARL